jgi:hypothetical protein
MGSIQQAAPLQKKLMFVNSEKGTFNLSNLDIFAESLCFRELFYFRDHRLQNFDNKVLP